MAHSTAEIKTVEDCRALIAKIQGQPGYVQPKAWAVGIVQLSRHGKPLATWFPLVNYFTVEIIEDEEVMKFENEGVATLLADQVGYEDGVATYHLYATHIRAVISALEPYRFDGDEHPNLEVLDQMLMLAHREMIVVTFIEDPITMPPEEMQDAYLRLHLLSHRKARPHEQNLDGLFGILPNNAWTNFGPMEPEDVTWAQFEARRSGKRLQVYGIDKFPRMTDYVTPSGVRIADTDRVRLGAHLAEGTTVMHEGFCNFNAGTLGPSMVEGRISAGVIVGSGTDVGGGASIMGTLSGGNDIIVSVGEDCLLEAESGLGIPLGNASRVEAGLYVKGTTPVRINRNEWSHNDVALAALANHPGGTRAVITIKAAELAGINDAIFRRNATSGAVEVIPRGSSVWGNLNPALHNN